MVLTLYGFIINVHENDVSKVSNKCIKFSYVEWILHWSVERLGPPIMWYHIKQSWCFYQALENFENETTFFYDYLHIKSCCNCYHHVNIMLFETKLFFEPWKIEKYVYIRYLSKIVCLNFPIHLSWIRFTKEDNIHMNETQQIR